MSSPMQLKHILLSPLPRPQYPKSIHEQVLPSSGFGALEEEEVGTVSLSQQQAGGGSKVPTLTLSSSWALMGK